MSDPNAVNDSNNTLQAQGSAPAGATSAGRDNSSQADISSTTAIHSMAELKEKAPKVYKAMLEGIAMKIVNDMQDSQARLKKMMDDAQRAAMGG